MKEMLAEKGRMVVESLLEQMSASNQDDLQKTLNASTVLQEFVDNENCFPILTEPSSMKKLVAVCTQSETNQKNLPYCLALLSTIINQFIDRDKDFFKDKKDEFFEVFSQYFRDLTYNCLIILR